MVGEATPAGTSAPRPGFVHETVLLSETMEAIRPKDGGVYADVTVGGGGHSEALLLRSGPSGQVVAFDRDPVALQAARERLLPFGDRVRFVHGTMSNVKDALRDLGVDALDGLIADVGVSSPQLDHAERGFSLQAEGPLDMRMDGSQGPTAATLIASWTTEELAGVLYRYGEERRSRAIAKAIHEAQASGALHTTVDLKRAIYRVTGPKKFRKGRRHSLDPATRTFQALRIAVNAELDELASLLRQVPELLSVDGVAVIISFHSLEDRIVKHTLRDHPDLSPLTKKPVVAGAAELEKNPRARSAKLRAARFQPADPVVEVEA